MFEEESYQIVRCDRCRLVYLANPPTESNIHDSYHESTELTSADNYREDSPDDALAELWEINRQRLKWLQKARSDGALLDVGCGRGFFVKTAASGGYDACGIDISPVAIAFAQRHLSVDAGTESLAELATGERTYSVVTMWHILEHFDDPCGELRHIYRMLDKDGLCLVEVPNFNSVHFRLSGPRWRGGNHPRYHRTFFTSGTLERMLARAGFSRVRRIQLNYRLAARGRLKEVAKSWLNLAALDSFLTFAAWK